MFQLQTDLHKKPPNCWLDLEFEIGSWTSKLYPCFWHVRLDTWYTPWGCHTSIFYCNLNLYLYLMVWLEFGHLHISVNTCATDLKHCTHLAGIKSRILCFMVWIGDLHTVQQYLHCEMLIEECDKKPSQEAKNIAVIIIAVVVWWVM